MSEEKWGNIRTMSREDLLLTKADIEYNLSDLQEKIDRAEPTPGILLSKKRRLMKAWTRVNTYLGVMSERRKAANNTAVRFFDAAKQELPPEVFRSLLDRAKTVGATSSAPSRN